MRIDCPFCGPRDHSEFTYGGDASVRYPPLEAVAEHWHEAVFLRENIRGAQFETWHHLHGCRLWLVVERDTLTHEIHAVRPAHAGIAALDGATTAPNASASAADSPKINTLLKTDTESSNPSPAPNQATPKRPKPRP